MNRVVAATGLITFVLGVALTALVLANPFGWDWMQSMRHLLIGRGDENVPHDVPTDTGGDVTGSPEMGRKIQHWRAPMDPTYISDQPGKSPMGMDLIPVYEDEEPLPPGAIRIDPVYVQNMGVQSEVVERRDIPFTIRTVATLKYDNSQITWITTKYEGWIETVHVNYVGEAVEKGQDLFEIYSPELVTTQKDYIQALAYAERMDGSDYPDIAKRAHALVEAARERLGYWDVSEEQIAELEAGATPRRTLTVTAPARGLVVEKMSPGLEGMFVRPGMNLYELVDLSTIWAEAEVFESQAPSLSVGNRARITLPFDTGATLTGRVRYLYPYVAEKTRTTKVSIELPNPGGKLRADMYVNVSFDVPAAHDVVAVPEMAVLRTGLRDVVVLDRGGGQFQVRDVSLGAQGGGYVAIRDGVEAGERVVVSSQFLIDSESNLREAIRKLTPSNAPPVHEH